MGLVVLGVTSRARRGRARACVAVGAAARASVLLPVGVCVAWLARQGALEAAVDLALRAIRSYTSREGAVDGPMDVVAGALRAHRRADLDRIRPRWVVTLAAPTSPIQSASWFVERTPAVDELQRGRRAPSVASADLAPALLEQYR